VARAVAQAKLAESEFLDQWEREKLPVEQELNDLQAKADLSAEERSRRDLLTEQLDTLNKRKQAEQLGLRAGKLRELTAAARDAEALQTLDSFWREGIFWSGACLFSLALLIVGFSGAGPERWMVWAMLAVIVFALFAGSRD
jgi:multidrug efflux pump subunit AcrA (membrane-fusion protein)